VSPVVRRPWGLTSDLTRVVGETLRPAGVTLVLVGEAE
jgi:hypothetical protein